MAHEFSASMTGIIFPQYKRKCVARDAGFRSPATIGINCDLPSAFEASEKDMWVLRMKRLEIETRC